MAASSSLTASAPHFCCLARRGVSPPWSYNSRERKYRPSCKRYVERGDQNTSLTIIYRATQFRCKATTLEVTLANETLLTGEEAVITAAAAEAVALARAALEVAKEAVQLYEKTDLSPKQIPQTSTLDSALLLDEKPFQIPFGGSAIQIQEKLTSIEQDVEVTVGSTRQDERRARRKRAVEKAAARVVPTRSGANKRRNLGFREKDYKDPMRIFKKLAGSFKPLTAAEERELSEGIQDLLRLKAIEKELAERNGQDPSFALWAAAAQVDQRMLRRRLDHGMRCKEKMMRCNIRLVISIARSYLGAGLAFEDLVQAGCRGLAKVVEKFDGSRGFKFSTYAYWWIKQSIRRSLSASSRLIHLPLNMVNSSYRVREAIKQLNNSGKTGKLDPEEIAKIAGVSKKKVQSVLMLPKNPTSLDLKIGPNKNIKLSDTIPCREQETLEFLFDKEFTKSGLDMVLDTLTSRENQVVRWRYGLEDGRAKTLQEIGDIIGISRERVRQIQSCAFRKLKSKKRIEILQEYIKV